MADFKESFQEYFGLDSLVILAFVVGGFYYVTPQQIEANTDSIEVHVKQSNQSFEALQSQIDVNSDRIRSIEKNYVPASDLEEFVTKKDLQNLEKIMREIQNSQDQRLDYIIKRLDDR